MRPIRDPLRLIRSGAAQGWRTSGHGRDAGFTLVEMVVVIAIAGIVAAAVALFIRVPVQNALESMQRAEFSDTADGALRRMSRDIRRAVPNSVRVTANGATIFLEFLNARSGGRYRRAPDPNVNCGGAWALGCDFLDFSANDTSFEVLGPAVEVAAGDQVVIYSLGIPGAAPYANAANISRAVNCGATPGCPGAVNRIFINSAVPFALDAPDARFFVTDTPVTYICAPNPAGGGALTRVWGYAATAAQPVAVPAGAQTALLATNVLACNFTYAPNAVAQRNALVTMSLTLGTPGNAAQGPVTVSLYHAIHISNVP